MNSRWVFEAIVHPTLELTYSTIVVLAARLHDVQHVDRPDRDVLRRRDQVRERADPATCACEDEGAYACRHRELHGLDVQLRDHVQPPDMVPDGYADQRGRGW